MCEICLKLTISTPERHYLRHSDVCIVNFEQVSLIVLVFPLLTFTSQRFIVVVILKKRFALVDDGEVEPIKYCFRIQALSKYGDFAM